MFFAFIAIGLELAAMALGALLILACCYRSCFRKKYHCVEGTNLDLDKRSELHASHVQAEYTGRDYNKGELHKRDEYDKHDSCHGFLKFVGYFTLLVSFLALIGTFIALGCFMRDVKNLERDFHGPAQQYNYDLEKLRKYSGDFKSLPRVDVELHREAPRVN